MLKERLKPLIKDVVVYGVAGGVSKFFMLFTLPIVVNRLSSSEFGVYSILILITNFLANFATFGMGSSVVFSLPDFTTADIETKKKAFTHGLFVQLLICAVCIPLLIIYSNYILNLFHLDVAYEKS